MNDYKITSSLKYKKHFEIKLFEKCIGKHHFNNCKIISTLNSLENKKRVYGEFIYILTVTGFHKTGAEATKLHTSSCNKNRDKLW